MAFSIYILQSDSSGRFYCGYSENVTQRLHQHNDPNYRLSKTTKRFKGPWNLVTILSCDSLSDAIKLERKIKKRGIARFLQDWRII
jgi:putative endonuclease